MEAGAAPDLGTDNRQRPETWNQCLSDNLTPGGHHWSHGQSHDPLQIILGFINCIKVASLLTGRLTRRHFTTLDISWTVLAGVITVLIELDFDFFLAHYKPPQNKSCQTNYHISYDINIMNALLPGLLRDTRSQVISYLLKYDSDLLRSGLRMS